MYAKTINYQCFIEEKDEFINLISNLILSNENLYDNLLELYSLRYKKEYDELEKKFIMFEGLKPEVLSIKPQFCLNQRTVDHQEIIKKKNLRSNSKQFNKNIKSQKKIGSEQPNANNYNREKDSLHTIAEVRNESIRSSSKIGKFKFKFFIFKI